MAAWQSSVRDVGGGGCRDVSRASWRHSDSSRSPSPLSGKLPIDMLSPFATALPRTARSQEINKNRVATAPSWTATATRTLASRMGITAAIFATGGGSTKAPARSRTPSPLTAAPPTVRRSRTPSPQPVTSTSQAVGNRTLASASGLAHVGVLPPPEPITDEGGPRATSWLSLPMGAEGRQWALPAVPSRAGPVSAATVASGKQATPSFPTSGVAVRKQPASPLWPAALPPAPGSASSTAVVNGGSSVAAVAAGEFAVLKLRKEVSDLRAELREVRAALSETPVTSRSPSLVSFAEATAHSLVSSRERSLSTGSLASHEKVGPTFGKLARGNLSRPAAQLGQQLSPIRSTSTSPEKMQNGISGATPPPWPSGVDVPWPCGADLQQQDEALSFACDLHIAASACPSYSREYDNEWSYTLGAESRSRSCPSLADTLLGATGAGTNEKPQTLDNGKNEVVLLHEESPWSGVNLGLAGTHNAGHSVEVPNDSRLGHSFEVPVDSLGCTFQGNRGCYAPASTGDELMDAAITSGSVRGQGSSMQLVHNGHGVARQSNVVEPRNVIGKARTENTPGSTSCDEELFTPSKDDSGSCILVSPSRLEVSYVMSSREEEVDIPLLDKDLAWTKALPAPPPTYSIPARKKEARGIVRSLPLPQKYLPPAPLVSHFATDDNFGQTTLMTSGMSELLGDDTAPTSTSVLIGMTSPMMSTSVAESVDASLSMAGSQASSFAHAPGESSAKSFETVDSGSCRSLLVTDFARSPQSVVCSDTSGFQRTCQRSVSSWDSFRSSPSTTLLRAPAPSFCEHSGSCNGSFSSSLEPKYFAVPPPKESFSVPPVPSVDLVTTPMRQALGSNAILTATSLPSAPLTPAVSVSTSRTATPPSRNVTPRRQQRIPAPSTVLSMSSVPSRSSSPSMAAVQVSRTAPTIVAPTTSGTCITDATLQGVGRARSLTPQRVVLSGSRSARSTPSVATLARDPLPARTPG